MYIGRFVC